jgi:DNA recombination protein RmuC
LALDSSLALVLAVLVVGFAVWLALRRGQGSGDAQRLDQLFGQIQTLTQTQAATQAAIDERLRQMTDRVHDRLSESASEAGKSLGDLKERLAVIDAAQRNIADLSTRMVSLQDILSNKQSRGAFGEVQLMDLVRTVLSPVNFEFQATLSSGKRVDCLLRLPNPPGPIGIDAKFPLEAYRAINDSKDDAALVAARRDFSVAIRRHARDIAEKYIVPGETADCALMFLPSEAVFAELHANFSNLVEEAGRQRVWIVSPTTLMATLTTMRAVLKDVRMREQAHVIQTKVSELMKDLGRLDERVSNLQGHFNQAVEDVRQIRISTDKAMRKSADIESTGLEEAAGAIAPQAAPNTPAAEAPIPRLN